MFVGEILQCIIRYFTKKFATVFVNPEEFQNFFSQPFLR